MRRRFIEFIWIYLFVSVFYGLLALLLFFPFHPISATGWGVWFLAALPVSVAGEAVGSAVFNKKTGKAINPDTEGVSVGRIGYGVIVTLIFIALILFVGDVLEAAGGDFWDTNFSSDW